MAKVIKLIYTEERRGLGKEGDPIRLCPQLWTLDGKLVAFCDPAKPEERPIFFAAHLIETVP